MENQKRCFVVMGFGIKTDFATGRKLDLNKSYRLLIKPVVEQKGLICVRADEIRHSGVIDVPMYHELLKADVVIADLSTANVNAFYELGIRHALRPRTTIVISEDKLTYPFDLNHINITSYTHLGDAIDYDEVERFRKVLGNTLDAVLNNEQPDSPVYTYLDDLVPPSLQESMAKASEDLGQAIDDVIENTDRIERKQLATTSKEDNPTLALLTEEAEEAIFQKDFLKAKSLFSSALYVGNKRPENKTIVNNPYLIQRLAFSTYKSKSPDEVTALKEAITLLDDLDLAHTNDPETVSLAGAIEKNLYENGEGLIHLENALLFFHRAFYLLHNRYNGINLAFLLNCKAASALNKTEEDIIADLVYANRTRQEVVGICDKDLQQLAERSKRGSIKESRLVVTNNETCDTDRKFWIQVNKAEAFYGLAMFEEFEKTYQEAKQLEHAPWMMKSFEGQLQQLDKLMRKNGYLINPVWENEMITFPEMPAALSLTVDQGSLTVDR
jgi:hypothetical protein